MMQKLKKNAGFTLAETLMTMLILLMVGLVMAEGVPAAVTAYGKAVDAANAQVLFSTTVNALRSELSTAKDVHLASDSSGGLIYISPATESKTKLYIGKEKTTDTYDTIIVQDFLKYDDETTAQSIPETENTPVPPRKLVSGSAQTAKLLVTYGSVGWDENQKDVLVFNNLMVSKPGNANAIVSIEKLYIRCLGVDIV